MRGLTFRGLRTIHHETIPDPVLVDEGDAIVRVERAGHGSRPGRRPSRLAFELVRPGGGVAIAGVHHESELAFSPLEAYDRNLALRIGRCPARSLMDELLPLIRVAPSSRPS